MKNEKPKTELIFTCQICGAKYTRKQLKSVFKSECPVCESVDKFDKPLN